MGVFLNCLSLSVIDSLQKYFFWMFIFGISDNLFLRNKNQCVVPPLVIMCAITMVIELCEPTTLAKVSPWYAVWSLFTLVYYVCRSLSRHIRRAHTKMFVIFVYHCDAISDLWGWDTVCVMLHAAYMKTKDLCKLMLIVLNSDHFVTPASSASSHLNSLSIVLRTSEKSFLNKMTKLKVSLFCVIVLNVNFELRFFPISLSFFLHVKGNAL